MIQFHVFTHSDEYTSDLIEGFQGAFNSLEEAKGHLEEIREEWGYYCTIAAFNDSTLKWDQPIYGFFVTANPYRSKPDHWSFGNEQL